MGAAGRRCGAAPQGGAQVAGTRGWERRLPGDTELQTKGAGGRPAAALTLRLVGAILIPLLILLLLSLPFLFPVTCARYQLCPGSSSVAQTSL